MPEGFFKFIFIATSKPAAPLGPGLMYASAFPAACLRRQSIFAAAFGPTGKVVSYLPPGTSEHSIVVSRSSTALVG